MPPGIKSPEMNVSDRELFKKSKIIEIGSVEKKVRAPRSWRFFEKIRKSEIFVPEIWDSKPKTVPTIEIHFKNQ